ncbi:MAG: hypothetical protein MZV65_37050 [Chromatiales bacterium]|nr:hypothetical protein [Chromatiales bacterium]
MIDVLNLFGFDAHAPGNWDFLYGPERFDRNLHRRQRQPAARQLECAGRRTSITPASSTPGAVCGVTDAGRQPAASGCCRRT